MGAVALDERGLRRGHYTSTRSGSQYAAVRYPRVTTRFTAFAPAGSAIRDWSSVGFAPSGSATRRLRGPSNGPTGRRSFRQMLHSLRPLRSRIAAFWPHASRRLPLGLAGQVRGPRSLAAPASWPYRRGITEPVCCSWPTRAAHSLESSCAHSRADQPGSIRNPVPSPQGRWCIRASCAITSENQSGEPASRLSGGTLSGLELAAPPLWVEYASQQVTRMSLLARVVPLQP